jgi:hypothetical protein
MPAGGTVVVLVVTPVGLQPPLVMVTVPAVLVMVMVTVPAVLVIVTLQLPSRIGRSLALGASVPATRRTPPPVQCRCRPTHQERLCLT